MSRLGEGLRGRFAGARGPDDGGPGLRGRLSHDSWQPPANYVRTTGPEPPDLKRIGAIAGVAILIFALGYGLASLHKGSHAAPAVASPTASSRTSVASGATQLTFSGQITGSIKGGGPFCDTKGAAVQLHAISIDGAVNGTTVQVEVLDPKGQGDGKVTTTLPGGSTSVLEQGMYVEAETDQGGIGQLGKPTARWSTTSAAGISEFNSTVGVTISVTLQPGNANFNAEADGTGAAGAKKSVHIQGHISCAS
jgi:hypothetical protein